MRRGVLMRLLGAVPLFLLAMTAPATAQPAPVRAPVWGDIFIYQAESVDAVFPDETELSAYTRRIKSAADASLSAAPSQAGVSGVLFVAIKPGRRARVWLLTSDAIAPAVRSALEQELGAIAPVDVRGGFLFGLAFGAWGASPYETAGRPPPIPAEWEAQIPPQGVMLDDAFINRVWPTDD